MSKLNNCPKCNISLIGSVIPEKYRHITEGNGMYYYNVIGIEARELYDGIIAYRCPDCNEEFPVDDGEWAQEMFKRYKAIRGLK